jgi:tetratricopeptide (TPR) repeat protein
VLVARAVTQESLGHYDEGDDDLTRALTLGLDPDDVNALDAVFNLGVHDLEARKYDRAEKLLLQAIEGYERVYGSRYPYIGHGQLALTRIAIARKQYDEAERHVLLAREVLDKHPDEYVYALDGHAALLLMLGRVDEAIELLTRAVDSGVDDPAYLAYLRSRLGGALAQGKHYEQALVQLDQAITALDGDPPQIDIVSPLIDRGSVWRELGHLDRSLASLERAVALTPETCGRPSEAAAARVELALTFDALGQSEQAGQAARQAHALLAKMPDEWVMLAPIESLLPLGSLTNVQSTTELRR